MLCILLPSYNWKVWDLLLIFIACGHLWLRLLSIHLQPYRFIIFIVSYDFSLVCQFIISKLSLSVYFFSFMLFLHCDLVIQFRQVSVAALSGLIVSFLYVLAYSLSRLRHWVSVGPLLDLLDLGVTKPFDRRSIVTNQTQETSNI